jgi:hypothetical protein
VRNPLPQSMYVLDPFGSQDTRLSAQRAPKLCFNLFSRTLSRSKYDEFPIGESGQCLSLQRWCSTVIIAFCIERTRTTAPTKRAQKKPNQLDTCSASITEMTSDLILLPCLIIKRCTKWNIQKHNRPGTFRPSVALNLFSASCRGRDSTLFSIG